MIAACKLAHLNQYPEVARETVRLGSTIDNNPPTIENAPDNANEPVVSTERATTPVLSDPHRPLTIYPEMNLSVEIIIRDSTAMKIFEDRRVETMNGYFRMRIQGRADWAFGHSPRHQLDRWAFSHSPRHRTGSGAVFIAIGAKSPKTFSQAETQLLAYLAIMRKLRQQETKQNIAVQGFYSDGEQYVFARIREDGKVLKSKTYNIHLDEGDMSVIFNWIVRMLVGASKSPPSSSPTKAAKGREEELANFDDRVFLQLYDPADNFDEEDIEGNFDPVPILFEDWSL